MSSRALMIVGRVRKAHGIRGELLVEPITDAPDMIFVSGRRLFAGTASGDPSPDAQELHITAVRPHMESVRLTLADARLRETRSQATDGKWGVGFIVMNQATFGASRLTVERTDDWLNGEFRYREFAFMTHVWSKDTTQWEALNVSSQAVLEFKRWPDIQLATQANEAIDL